MERCEENDRLKIRLLGLGNEILADDAFGVLVAREVERALPGALDVAASSAAGFNLMDDLLGAPRLVIVDTIMTGASRPGTIHILATGKPSPGAVSAHMIGIWEVLAAARQLGLEVPTELRVIAVEAADCSTIGGAMHPDVQSAISTVTDLIRQMVPDEDA